MDGPPALFVGTLASARLADALGVRHVLRPPAPPPDRGWAPTDHPLLETWRSEVEAGPQAAGVVVCTWADPPSPAPLATLEPEAWRTQVEWPTSLWFTTVVAAAGRCRDGGALVVVVERPATLDAPGHATTVVVSDGLVNLVRSLAAVEGARGVRVNVVTTEVHTAPDPLLGAAPPLSTFPGRVGVEVAGAVRLLLSPDAVGVTGTALAADCGRG
ncbi:SDR family oxidoreductase [Iamia sp. SCSIO 61187]|uniref:SDR family oxidoreductase n=1 Tax=Iamia sp. SCSIO 61187 TaxID=2722752 RepID=UPI001C62D120|nr:SDR family oxidoreductase [Iamia sp. SCSIO 61187]QYG93183.1 SDR family oxidoreductase [Iamia sp. SCSIO 61187]